MQGLVIVLLFLLCAGRVSITVHGHAVGLAVEVVIAIETEIIAGDDDKDSTSEALTEFPRLVTRLVQ